MHRYNAHCHCHVHCAHRLSAHSHYHSSSLPPLPLMHQHRVHCPLMIVVFMLTCMLGTGGCFGDFEVHIATDLQGFDVEQGGHTVSSEAHASDCCKLCHDQEDKCDSFVSFKTPVGGSCWLKKTTGKCYPLLVQSSEKWTTPAKQQKPELVAALANSLNKMPACPKAKPITNSVRPGMQFTQNKERFGPKRRGRVLRAGRRP